MSLLLFRTFFTLYSNISFEEKTTKKRCQFITLVTSEAIVSTLMSDTLDNALENTDIKKELGTVIL